MTTMLLLAGLLTAHFGRVSEVHGEAYLVAEETQPLYPNFLIEPGDLVETRDGRVEIELSYGTVVWLGRDSKVWFQEISEDRRAMEVLKGRVYVRNRHEDSEVVLEVPQGFLRIPGKGAVRLRVRKNGFVYARVTDGRLEVDTDEAHTVLTEGEELELDPFGYITYRPYAFDEDFDRWCVRRERVYVTVEVVPYVPPGIWIGLVDLSLHGRWIWLPPYGWVWVPRTFVAASWRPYLYGHWVFYADIGWVWVSYEPWGWVPYHYGRWVHVPGQGWVWIPGGTFGGGWVAWHTSDGVVAWAPLGPDDQPVRVGRRTAWVAVSRSSFLHPRLPQPAELGKKPVVPYKEVRLARVPDRNWHRQLSLKPSDRSPVVVRRPRGSFRRTEPGLVSRQRVRTPRGSKERVQTGRQTARRFQTPGRDLRQERHRNLLPPSASKERHRASERLRRSATSPRLHRSSDHQWIRRSFESVLKRITRARGNSEKARKVRPSRPGKKDDDRPRLRLTPGFPGKPSSGR